MLAKALIVLTLAFFALGAFRFAMARPRPSWVGPLLAAIVLVVVASRFPGVAMIVALPLAAAFFLAPRFIRGPAVAEDLSAARSLLGVAPAASADEIRAAHRTRITAAHPDRGGVSDLAARLNAARDLLLKEVKR